MHILSQHWKHWSCILGLALCSALFIPSFSCLIICIHVLTNALIVILTHFITSLWNNLSHNNLLFRPLVLCQNITIFSKICLLKLSNREIGAASLCLFSSLYCWVWMHICLNSAVRMYWMSVWACSCVFGADFEQICIAEIEILCVKSLVFHASIDVKFYNFYMCQYAFFCHSREHFVFECYIRKSSESSQICGQAKTTQLNFVVILNIDSCGNFFIQSSTLHKYFELHIIWLNHLPTSILFDWTIPVAVHWLNSFSNCIEFDWTVYLVIYYLLNCSPNRVCWICH